MSLEDSLKEMKEQLEKQLAEEAGTQEKIEESAPEPEDEAPVPEEAPEPPEEPAKEEPKPEPKKEELDDSGYARLRREKQAAERKAQQESEEKEALRRELEALKSGTALVEETSPMAPELDSIIQEHRFQQATREFMSYEDSVRRQDPNYDAVAAEYVSALSHAIKIQNPTISNVDLVERTRQTILLKASELLKAGYENPVAEMHQQAKELGFTGASRLKKEEPEVKEEKAEIKPDLKKLAENRKRSAGMAGVGGGSESRLTPQHVTANFSLQDWGNLTPAQKREVMSQLGQ